MLCPLCNVCLPQLTYISTSQSPAQTCVDMIPMDHGRCKQTCGSDVAHTRDCLICAGTRQLRLTGVHRQQEFRDT